VKDHTLITALEQYWTDFSNQNPPPSATTRARPARLLLLAPQSVGRGPRNENMIGSQTY